MTTDLPIREDKVIGVDVGRNEIGYDGVVKSVSDPRPERVHAEEGALLSEKIQLWVAVEKPGRDELVKNPDSERR